MRLGEDSLRVAIAGAASLRGQDLKQYLDESGFPAGEVRLFDEEVAVGTLTEVGGEAAVVQPIDELSFQGLRFVFFAGSRAFSAKHGPAAAQAGATVIDLTGELSALPGARPWIQGLDAVLAPPEAAGTTGRPCNIYAAPSTPAIVACSLSSALREFGLTRLVMIFFQPVSERGRLGVEELENQTVKLLSFQPVPQQVFDAQVAFNLLDRWGPASQERLADMRAALALEVRRYLVGRAPVPVITLIQAPVFYGHAFAAYAEFAGQQDAGAFPARLETAGFLTARGDDAAPSNVSVAGEQRPVITSGEQDPGADSGYWFWGAADSLRLATANATRIAERLLAS
jgi:aspartate-semialdehyde dehydrogenase